MVGERYRFVVTQPAPVPPVEVDGLLAGAAEVDITPPPGLPKAGYSSNARTGTGFRTRLRARVLHLRSGRASVALVACDLLGGSAVLQHRVAAAVAGSTDVPLAGLLIGATHTHAGPGQFLGTDFYNRFASNRSGFDPGWADFLVERIASAVRVAVDTRRPAAAALGATSVWGLTRNRSLLPHVRNDTVADKRLDAQRKFVSVDPDLRLLRVDGLEGDPIGAMVWFGIHGTGVSQHACEYHADVWAYLVGELMSSTGVPVVGAMEGTHADIAPALRPGGAGHVESERVGRAVGAHAARLWHELEPRLASRFELRMGLRELNLDESRTEGGVTLPDRPAVGAALVAGATENLTPVVHRLPPFRAGHRRRRSRPHPQGAKWVLGGPAQRVILPLRGFPRVVPVQVIGLHGVPLLALPFEITTEVGRRLRAAVRAAVAAEMPVDAGGGVAGGVDVVVSSVANEYAGYVTTPEEYEAQFYEGGHTLYGPATAPFLCAAAARLTADVWRHGVVSEPVPERRFDLAVQRYLPEPVVDTVTPRRFVGRPVFHDPTLTTDGYWSVGFLDAAPAALRWHERLVTAEIADPVTVDDTAVLPGTAALPASWVTAADDQGWHLEVVHLGPFRGDGDGRGAEERAWHRYEVRWFAPPLAAGRRYRVVLEPNAGRPRVASPPFD